MRMMHENDACLFETFNETFLTTCCTASAEDANIRSTEAALKLSYFRLTCSPAAALDGITPAGSDDRFRRRAP